MAKLCPFRIPNTEPPLYNVKTGYGAVGDGVTDDTTAVQAAITAAGAVGNGAIVYFPAGTYLTKKLTLASNIELRGPYTSGTPRPTAWAATLVHAAENQSHLRVENKTNITLRYLAFDGDRIPSDGGYNNYIYNTPYLKVYDCYFTGYCGNGAANPALQITGCVYVTIDGCTFVENGQAFVLQDGCNYGSVTNCLSRDNTLSIAEMFAIYSTGTATHNNTISGCTIQDTKCGYAFAFQGPVNANLITDNTITNCTAGVVFDDGAYDNVFSLNVLTAGASSTGCGMKASNDAGDNNQILSNTVTAWTDTDGPLSNSASGTVIDGNTITGSYYCWIHDGDGVEFADNIIAGATQGGLLVQDAATDGLVITGNDISTSYRSGIKIATNGHTNITVDSNHCYNNGTAGYGSDSGITFTGTASGVSLDNNHCYDDQGTHTQGYGINVAAACTGTYHGNTSGTGEGNINADVYDGLSAD